MEGPVGLRSWGSDPGGSTTMLVGTYAGRGEVSQRLLDALPPLLWLPGAELDPPLVGLLATEMARDEPGQDAVLDRLLDLLLIAVLRAWFARRGDRGGGRDRDGEERGHHQAGREPRHQQHAEVRRHR